MKTDVPGRSSFTLIEPFDRLRVPRAKSKSFTLVELLVVITIISVLAGLLLPGLRAARQTAYQARCLSNLRQIGVGAHLYLSDQDEFMFPAQPGPPVDHWINLLYADYVARAKAIFLCPSTPPQDCFNPYGGTGAYGELTRASYLMNVIATDSITQIQAWNDSAAPYAGAYASALKYGWTPGSSALPLRTVAVRAPSQNVFVCDMAPPLTNSLTAKGIFRYRETDHGLPDGDGNGETNSGERKVGFQHNGRFAVLYGDSHVDATQRTAPDQWVVVTRPPP